MKISEIILSNAVNPRLERKFYLGYDQMYQLWPSLNLSPLGFREIYYQRRVNNVYYDTVNLNYFADNAIGTQERVKVRERWYEENNRVLKSNLEIKFKQNELGYKLNWEWEKKSEWPLAIREWFKSLKPVNFNSYLRRYFLSANGLVRLTIDEQIVFADDRHKRNSFESDKVVVELKYDPKDELWAVRAANSLPLSLQKNSKYVDGILYKLS